MARPVLASDSDAREAVLALLREAGLGSRVRSSTVFRQAVSIRKVRDRLGGGNMATIGRVIKLLEAELVVPGAPHPVELPSIPPEIAELMTGLWRGALDVRLSELDALRSQAQEIADRMQAQLRDALLRAELLTIELSEVRTAVTERDVQVAQLSSERTALHEQCATLRGQVDGLAAELLQERAVASASRAEAHAAVESAKDRYEGLSQRLLVETAQQRQAAQDEIARLVSQLKFAEKRHATLEARVTHLDAALTEMRTAKEQANGEVSALRYVNASLKTQLDGFVRELSNPPVHPTLKLPRAKKPRDIGATASATRRTTAKK